MKKFLTVAVTLMLALSMYAEKDVTKFLGIPVDGTKSEMISKLKAKGFTSTSYDKEILEGEFNGQDVLVFIVTNNNKVYRIMVSDATFLGESDIKIRFNNLCYQFQQNERYRNPLGDQIIDSNEDLSYQMLVKNKRYEAIYYQGLESDLDSIAFVNDYKDFAWKKISSGEITEVNEESVKKVSDEFVKYRTEQVQMKQVWFIISEYNGKYGITMYYDNKYNQANGEDL